MSQYTLLTMCLLILCIIITILFYADTSIVEQPTELPNVNLKHKLDAQKSDIGNSTNKLQASPKSSNEVKIFFWNVYWYIIIIIHFIILLLVSSFENQYLLVMFFSIATTQGVSLKVVKNFEVKNCISICYYFVYCVLCRQNT